ncbi:DinB family protein [Nocardioides sp. LHG3406-4]|uniref:DinB family protein n=1 Tax=Nocardioides sp. LHG3406-4 TaxID=2804575 RepID=UPI003CEB00EA
MSLERTSPPYSADEVTMLRSFLDYFRVTVRRQAAGLTQQQLATALPTSPLTLGGMLKHLTFVEQWWFTIVFLGDEAQGLWADVDWDADEDWDWHSAAHDSPDQLLAWHEQEVARSNRTLDDALAAGDLDQLATRQRHKGQSASLRWILVHLIEEYARHAGHADLIREAIDQKTDL